MINILFIKIIINKEECLVLPNGIEYKINFVLNIISTILFQLVFV